MTFHIVVLKKNNKNKLLKPFIFACTRANVTLTTVYYTSIYAVYYNILNYDQS